MNQDTGKHISEADAGNRDDDTVAKLMNLAGPRADIPADIEARVYKKVSQDWRSATKKKTAVRWAVPAAIAATVLIVMAFNFRATESPLLPVGFVAQVGGNQAAVVGDTVYAGESLETVANHGLSISLNGDISLRLASDTLLRIDSAEEITLLHGQLYADSGEHIYRDRHITVHTAGGSATDIGTQFSVSYDGEGMSIAVREGRVDVARDQSVITADAGDKLLLQPDREAVFDQISAYDSAWDWATSLAPGFDIKDRSLLDFLKWASRETGKTLIFSNDEVRMAAMGTDLFGSIIDFTPNEAVDAVLSTTQFKYRMDERSITISK
jgi:hypothetical protein